MNKKNIIIEILDFLYVLSIFSISLFVLLFFGFSLVYGFSHFNINRFFFIVGILIFSFILTKFIRKNLSKK